MKKLFILSLIILLSLSLITAQNNIAIKKITIKNETVNSNLNIKDNKINLSNGRLAEIKIMPSTVSDKAIEVLNNKNITLILKEVGNKLLYEAEDIKEIKLLFLFNVREKTIFNVDAESGEIFIKKPWWSFLVTKR